MRLSTLQKHTSPPSTLFVALRARPDVPAHRCHHTHTHILTHTHTYSARIRKHVHEVKLICVCRHLSSHRHERVFISARRPTSHRLFPPLTLATCANSCKSLWWRIRTTDCNFTCVFLIALVAARCGSVPTRLIAPLPCQQSQV